MSSWLRNAISRVFFGSLLINLPYTYIYGTCPANAKHLYTIYTMLTQRPTLYKINVIQMFCVYWADLDSHLDSHYVYP